MKRIILLSLISFYIFGGDLESYNLIISKEIKRSDKIETQIKTQDNMLLSIISEETLTLEQQDLVGRTFLTFFNWTELNITSAQLVFEGRRLSIIFQLKDLNYKDVEISQYLPSGIQLYYDTFYEYDFRMFKDGMFMRLKGQYYSKEEFLEELYSAITNPLLYVQIHDPSYIIKQIDLLKVKNQTQDRKFFDLLEKHTKLEQEYLDLLKKHNLQIEIQNKLKDGIISLSNKSFFGSLNAFDKSIVEKIINAKTNNPKFTVKEVITTLKAKEIKVSDKIVEAVFIIYFNEFPQNVK